MAFFQSLPLDIKVLVAAFVALCLLHFFSNNQKTQKFCVVVLVLLAVGGVYRYQATRPPEKALAQEEPIAPVTTTSSRAPIVSTAGK